jgi:hypothetical protein
MTLCCLVLNLPPKKEIDFYRHFYNTITPPLQQFSVSRHASPWFNSLIKALAKSSFCYPRCSFVSLDQCFSLASSWAMPYCLQNLFNVSLPISSSLVCWPLAVSGYHIIQSGDLYYPLFTPNLRWHCRYFLEVCFFLFRWWSEIISV